MISLGLSGHISAGPLRAGLGTSLLVQYGHA
jgi:hypothetical protein